VFILGIRKVLVRPNSVYERNRSIAKRILARQAAQILGTVSTIEHMIIHSGLLDISNFTLKIPEAMPMVKRPLWRCRNRSTNCWLPTPKGTKDRCEWPSTP
jgi:hypothetical protein